MEKFHSHIASNQNRAYVAVVFKFPIQYMPIMGRWNATLWASRVLFYKQEITKDEACLSNKIGCF